METNEEGSYSTFSFHDQYQLYMSACKSHIHTICSALIFIPLLPHGACWPLSVELPVGVSRREFGMADSSVVKSLLQQSISLVYREAVGSWDRARGRQQHGFLTHHQYCSFKPLLLYAYLFHPPWLYLHNRSKEKKTNSLCTALIRFGL